MEENFRKFEYKDIHGHTVLIFENPVKEFICKQWTENVSQISLAIDYFNKLKIYFSLF